MDAGQWYRSLPRFTRYWLTATVVLSLLCRFELLSISALYLDRSQIFGSLQLWRCVTSLFVFPITPNTAFHFLINCYFIVQYSTRLEKDQYSRSPSDYLYLLIVTAVLANIGGLLFQVNFLMDMMVMAVTYIWCQLNKDVTVSFWFGSRFKAIYLPWVLAAFEFIFKFSLASLLGIFNGHVYFFLKFQYSQELGGNALLETPQFLKRLVPDTSGGFGGFGVPPESRAPPRAPENPWGRGMTLGTD
ncbi:derlin-1 isoform X1 [Drosophila subobscura]|uniref:derlin-1 isoform X1 n=2 Tax=Drosophila subobscura TaxID=7241 RepID=UPI00155A43B3|nr:derlin-1 isoform X1 [Drosophila subobscura]